jgi:hypothetical protein
MNLCGAARFFGFVAVVVAIRFSFQFLATIILCGPGPMT